MNRVHSISSMLRYALVATALLVAAHASAVHAQTAPRIVNAKVEGKKLIITGENFEPRAKILIDGSQEKTKNLADDPTGTLIAKKGSKRIGFNQVVTLHVINPDGIPSSGFRFFGGPTLTLADLGKTVDLVVGQQFLVKLGGGYAWTVHFSELTNLVAVPTLLPILGAQGIYEPVTPGKVAFIASGEPNCNKDDPACPKEPLVFEVTIMIKNE
jgi:hypothetical protein